MTDAYREALKKAEQELADSNSQAEKLERQRAKLRQTIAVLRSLLGAEARPDGSITDAILTVTKAGNGFITAAHVMDRLVMMGYQIQTATVATILSRLAKNGHLVTTSSADGGTGYAWNPSTTDSQRRDVLREAMEKAGAGPTTPPRRRSL